MRGPFVPLLALALALGCSPEGPPGELAPPEQLVVQAAPLPAQGPYVRVTFPTDNSYINLAGPPPSMVAIQFEFVRAPGDTTGSLLVTVDEEETELLSPPVSPIMRVFGAGPHTVTLRVANDSGEPYTTAQSRTTVTVKVSSPCTVATDCDDGNPCSSDLCLPVGVDHRCQYGDDPFRPDCCRNEFECPTGEMCVDLFPLYGPDGIKECVQCDGTPANCPPRPCQDARCHELSFSCVYTPREGNCCVPGGVACALAPCEACLSEDGFEGVCGPAGPPGSCCLEDDAAAGAPDYGCATGHPCEIPVCEGHECKNDLIYDGCCTEDVDCRDPAALNACTGEQGVCRSLAGEPPRGVCAYPHVVDECCVSSDDCADRLPELLGICPSETGAPASCEYVPNPEYCATQAPGVVVTELLADSPMGYTAEWIELFNTLDVEIDLLGWHLENPDNPADSIWFTGDSAIPLAPGGYFVVGHVRDTNVTGGVRVDHDGFGLDLSTSGGGLRVVDRDGRESDVVRWDATYPILAGRSMARTSPYRGGSAAAWRQSSVAYGPGGFGTPGAVNLDVHDPSYTPPICDDGDPCTLDICHGTQANLCRHIAVSECCAEENDPDCADRDECTLDTCDVGTRTCRHEFDVGRCCQVDGDCPPAPPGKPLWEEAAFAFCTFPRCLGQRCAYVRYPDRPGCCISDDHPDLGCADSNRCTADACIPGAGSGFPAYPMCVYAMDADGDGKNECCDTDADCDDSDPTTAERCRQGGTSAFADRCVRGPDSDYCGPLAATHDCDDGIPCTADTCCQEADDPVAGCPGTYRCLHVPTDDCCLSDEQCDDGDPCTHDACCSGPGVPYATCERAGGCAHLDREACCRSDADCEAVKPPESLCETAYCLGGRCLYAEPAAWPGCCRSDTDCDVDGDRCTIEACSGNVCVLEATLVPPQCCYSSRDCPASMDPCERWVCSDQACVLRDVPSCCYAEEEGLSEPCDDGNPCTQDVCRHGRCRVGPRGGPGCCTSPEDCPATGSPCAVPTCDAAAFDCRAVALTGCRAILPYHESFWMMPEYADDLRVATLGWSLRVLSGEGAALWEIGRSPLIGGRAARFLPTAAVEACLVSPALDTRGLAVATLQWRDAWHVTGAGPQVRVGVGDDPSAWPRLWPSGAVAVDGPPAWHTATLPGTALDSPDTRVAFCVEGGGDSEWALDEVVVAAGTPPVFTSVPRTTVVAFAGNERFVPLAVADSGLAPDGLSSTQHVALRVVGARFARPYPDAAVVGDGAWLSLWPVDDDVGPATVTVIASDGALEARTTVSVEARAADCTSAADCDDADPCTTATCRPDGRCSIRHGDDCRP